MKEIFTLLSVLLLSLSSEALDTIMTGYRVNNSGTLRLDAWGKCRDITNSSGADHFVATRTQPEWWSFISNTPAGMGVAATCPINVEYTTTAHKVMPTGALGTTVAGTNGWTNSLWGELTASTTSAIVITGMMVDPANANGEFEVDIGKGAAGAETVVATLAGLRASSAGGPWWIELPIPIDNIASGQRVAVRFRKQTNSTNNWGFKVGYYEKPLGGNVDVTANPSKVIPAAAVGTSVTPNTTAWANSAWTEVSAATASAMALGGYVVVAGDNVEYELDVGTGTAGSETVITTFRGIVPNGNGGPYTSTLKPALDNIASGARLAIRMRKAGTDATAWRFKLLYYDSPTGLTLPTQPLKWSPTAAAGASITPSNTAWANSNWRELIASASTDLQVAAIEFDPAVAVEFELELGVGAAGSEYAIGAIRGNCSSTGLLEYTLPFRPLLNTVPSGSRLAVRLRKSGTSTAAWPVSVGYYENSSSNNKMSAHKKTEPAAAVAVSLTPSGTSWNNSSYVQLIASTSNQVFINSISYAAGVSEQFEFDIATGAASSETVVATVAGNIGNTNGNQILYLPVPLSVAASTRVAIRMRKNGTNTNAWNAGVNFTEIQ